MLSYRKLAMRVLGRPLHTGGGIDSPRPASQRAAAFILTAAMLTTLAAPAFAGTWYIEDGDMTISAGTKAGTNKVEQVGKETVENDRDTIVTNRKEDTASSHTVTIDAKDEDDKVEVTLKDVNIEATGGKAAVSVTGSGNTTIELDGDNKLSGSGAHAALEHNQTVDSERNVTSGKLTIQDDNDKAGSLTATGGIQNGAGIGAGGYGVSSGKIEITGGDITAVGGKSAAGIGGSGYRGNADITISGGTIRATGGDQAAGIGGGTSGNGKVTITGDAVIEESIGGSSGAGAGNATGGAGIGAGGDSTATTDITLEGKVTINATAGKDNAAIGANGIEQEFPGLAGGTSITRKDSDKNDIPPLPGDNVPTPSGGDTAGGGSTGGGSAGGDSTGGGSTGGGSADTSVQESVFPGLVVTDKDGQRISYTSIRGNNVLSLRVGRFTASFRISLAALRQLRAEGIDTITFQTILCSTTLSVDELLAMGGEDAEAVLTHRLTASSLTVG